MSGSRTSRSSASCTASLWMCAMHSARRRSSVSRAQRRSQRRRSSAGALAATIVAVRRRRSTSMTARAPPVWRDRSLTWPSIIRQIRRPRRIWPIGRDAPRPKVADRARRKCREPVADRRDCRAATHRPIVDDRSRAPCCTNHVNTSHALRASIARLVRSPLAAAGSALSLTVVLGRLRAHRGAAGRAAAAEGHRGRGASIARRHRVGRVHRPARGREHRRRPAARLGLRLRRALRRRRGRPQRRPAVPDRSAAVPGRSRSAARRAGARRRDRRSAPTRSCSAPSGCAPRTRCRTKSTSAAPRSRAKSTAQVAAVEAALRAAELNLEFTRVTAPIAGRVGRAIVTEGNLVSSGPGRGDAADDAWCRSIRSTRTSTPTSRSSCSTSDLAQQGRRDSARDVGAADSHGAGRATAASRAKGSSTSSTTSSTRHRHDPRPRHLPQPDRRPDARACSCGCCCPAATPITALLIQDRAVGTDLDKRFVFVVNADRTRRVPRRSRSARSSTACASCAPASRPATRSWSTACSGSSRRDGRAGGGGDGRRAGRRPAAGERREPRERQAQQ